MIEASYVQKRDKRKERMLLESFSAKSGNFKRAMMIVALASMVSASLHVQTARADPITIEVIPTSAPVGSTVTITGINATAGATVRLYLIGMFFLATNTANGTGGYSINITVPAVPSDVYWITALDDVEGDTASTMFTVEPRIVLSPTQGGFESKVNVNGDGFERDSDITIFFDGNDVTPFPPPRSDPLGSFESSFTINSPYPNGTYIVEAFDFWGTVASAEFYVIPRIRVWPKTSGSPTSLAFVEGSGFAVSVNATLHFGSVDVSPYPWFMTDGSGSFQVPFFVPEVPNGIYTINATDVNGNTVLAQYVVPSPILMLTPSRVSGSSIVTARGIGFMYRSAILLYLEDITMTHLIDLMWMSPKLQVAEDGSFEYSFIVPVTEPGVYTVGAYVMLGGPPSDLQKEASAPLTIVDDTPIDIEVNVGSVHFRGEMAEFYVKTAFAGALVNAKIDAARLYYSNGGSSIDLTSSVQLVATGLYRIPYDVPSNATQGAYTLVVESHYYAEAVEAYGTGSGSFLLSPTLTSGNAQLVDVSNKIGTVIIPDLGVIKVNLTAINARLVNVEGTEATIQSDIGELQTTTDTINAKTVSIDGNVATISSDLGTIMSRLNTTGFQLEVATLVFALLATAGSLMSIMLIRKMKPPTPAPSPPSNPGPSHTDPPEPEAPSTQSTDAAETIASPEMLNPAEETTSDEQTDTAESSSDTEMSETPE